MYSVLEDVVPVVYILIVLIQDCVFTFLFYVCNTTTTTAITIASDLGTIDDFDPLRGLHHVNFRYSNAQGNWEGWFKLDGGNCQLLNKETPTYPSPPQNLKKGTFKQRKKMVVPAQSGGGGGGGGGGAMYDDVLVPAFERSAVAEAFERQARGMGGGGAVSM